MIAEIQGENVFRRLRAINPDINFILLTGFLEPETRERMQNMGVRENITKPYKTAELLLTIRAILDRKT